MNDDILVREFEAALQGEPPLGFDPDDVVTTAARRQRRRRASVLAGVGVVAVAVVAVAVPAALTRTPVSPAVTSAAPPTIGNWPPAGVSWPTLSQQQLTDQQATSLDHLVGVLPEVTPGWTLATRDYGFVGRFGTPVTSGNGHETDQQGFGNAVTVRSGEKVLGIDVAARVPLGTDPPTPLAQRCATQREGIVYGDKVTCTMSARADGSVLVVTHTVLAFKPGAHYANGRHQEMLLVQDFRPDGTQVDVESDINPGASEDYVLPTVAQLTALAVDPGFHVSQ